MSRSRPLRQFLFKAPQALFWQGGGGAGRPEEERVQPGLGHLAGGGCCGQAAGEIPGVCELAGVQREESCKQRKVPGLCSCLLGTGLGPTCGVEGTAPSRGRESSAPLGSWGKPPPAL